MNTTPSDQFVYYTKFLRLLPLGWAELVGHKLEGPRMALPTKKEKKKTVGKRGKKRSHNNGAVSPGSGLSQVSCKML